MADPEKPDAGTPPTVEPVTPEPAASGPDPAIQETKWWIDTGIQRGQEPAEREPKGVIERWAFELLKDYRQERALQNIVDINGQVLRELGNNDGRWVHVSLGVGEFPARRLNHIKDALRIPRYARALAIDAGYSVRILVTGDPRGEKLLDINFTESPSLDYWINGELMEEQTYRSIDDALKRLRNSVHRYLRKDSADAPA